MEEVSPGVRGWGTESASGGRATQTPHWVRSYLTSLLMILREGVNSPLMKFAKDIKWKVL